MRYPFPKAELHFHLDGAMIPETTMRLAAERGVKLPEDNIDDFKKFLKRTADCGDVGEFLARFAMPTEILQDKAALAETTYDTIAYLNKEVGLDYAEIRFAPQLHTLKGLTQRDSIDAVLEGKRKAAVDFPSTKVRIILCCMIEPYDNHLDNEETVRLYEEYFGDEICAIDLAGFEDSVPMDSFAYLFDSPREKGLNITIHAGDNGVPINCSKVIDWGATRIGHGHHCFYDEAVLKKVIDTQTCLETCLSSNIQCKTEPSYALHPAKKLLDMGANLMLSTDNMVFSYVTVEDEYDHALNDCGFTYNDLIKCNINAFRSAFMPEEEKAMYIAKLETFLEK